MKNNTLTPQTKLEKMLAARQSFKIITSTTNKKFKIVEEQPLVASLPSMAGKVISMFTTPRARIFHRSVKELRLEEMERGLITTFR